MYIPKSFPIFDLLFQPNDESFGGIGRTRTLGYGRFYGDQAEWKVTRSAGSENSSFEFYMECYFLASEVLDEATFLFETLVFVNGISKSSKKRTLSEWRHQTIFARFVF